MHIVLFKVFNFGSYTHIITTLLKICQNSVLLQTSDQILLNSPSCSKNSSYEGGFIFLHNPESLRVKDGK